RRAAPLDWLACSCQPDRIAAVQQELNILSGKLLRNRASNSTTRARDEITLHKLVGTPRCGVRTAQRAVPTIALRSSQSETVIGRFPQPQTHELVVEAMVDLRPKRAHDVFAGGWDFTKILGLQIEVSVPPRFKRLQHCILHLPEIVECSAAFVVISAHGRLGDIKMTVPVRIVA